MYCMNSLLCQIKLLSRHIGKSVEEIAQDIKRPKYFSPSEAVDYGIIDKVKFLEWSQKKKKTWNAEPNLTVFFHTQVLYNEKSQEDGGVVSELKRSNLI